MSNFETPTVNVTRAAENSKREQSRSTASEPLDLSHLAVEAFAFVQDEVKQLGAGAERLAGAVESGLEKFKLPTVELLSSSGENPNAPYVASGIAPGGFPTPIGIVGRDGSVQHPPGIYSAYGYIPRDGNLKR